MVVRFGLNLGDAPPDLPAAAQLDVYRRQVEVGQRAGFRDFFVGHHYAYATARWFQPFPLLARLTAELEPDTRIGTGILVAPLVSPIVLAEEAATLAAMAPGRVVLGLGTGYRRVEYDALGIAWDRRQELLQRAIRVIREQWAGETSVVDGVEVTSGCRLEPAAWPGLVVGAKSRTGALLAGRSGAGLLGGSKQPLARLADVVEAHRAAWAGPGEPPRLILMRNLALGSTVEEAANALRARAGARMASYQREGLQLGAASPFGESDDLCETALLGTPDRVRREAQALVRRLGAASILLRAQWPGLSPSTVDRWLLDVGHALADLHAEPPVSATVPDPDHRDRLHREESR